MLNLLLFLTLVTFLHASDPFLGIWTSPPKAVPSTKTVDGPLLGNGDMGVVLGSNHTNELQFYIGKNDFWYFGQNNEKYGKRILGLGGISFTMEPNNTKNNYRLEQHSDKGYIIFNISSLTGNATVSQDSNSLIINFDDFSSNINYSLFCIRSSSYAKTVTDINGNWCRRDTTSNVIFVSAAIAMNVTLNKNTFIVSVASNFDINSNSTDEIVETAVKMSGVLAENKNNEIQKIWNDNNEFFKSFWNLSSVSIPNEPLIMEYWYKSLYIQLMANRQYKVAPGLWGPFVTSDGSAWNGDYTLNYNFEAPYYGLYSSNHINLTYPYYDPILNYTKQGMIDAQYYYNCSNSLHYPGHITPFGYNNSGDMGQHSDVSFASLNFINHFRYTYDIDFITKNNNEIYNFLTLIANWWICWLDRYESSGVYIDKYDCTRENCYPASVPNNTNPAISLSFIRFLLTNLIVISNVANISNPLISKYKNILSNLSPIPIGQFEKTNVLLPQESPYYFKPGDNPLQLYGIWPGEQIGLGVKNESLLTIGINTVDKVASWDQGNAYCEMYPSAIRVGYNINKTLDEWNSLLKTHMPQNGYVSMGGGGMDASGAIIAVNEMLLQSWNNNTIHLFPVYNFGNASFNNLRAVGAFLVSSTMVNSVITSPVEIYSEKGNICKIVSPWNTNEIKVCKMDSNNECNTNVPINCDTNNICMFDTESSVMYQLFL